MGKKPTIDFKMREVLDGTEELYTQNENYEPKEQKFRLRTVMTYILDFLFQNLPRAINGLTLNDDREYELGGRLEKDTQIDSQSFTPFEIEDMIDLGLVMNWEGNKPKEISFSDGDNRYVKNLQKKLEDMKIKTSNNKNADMKVNCNFKNFEYYKELQKHVK